MERKSWFNYLIALGLALALSGIALLAHSARAGGKPAHCKGLP